MEQYSRRKQVRLIGIKESETENLSDMIQVMLREKLQLNNINIAPQNCFRIGKKRSDSEKPRQVMLRLFSLKDRSLIMKEKKKLKGTGIVVVEDLTRTRHRLLKAAQGTLGKNRVWTSEGSIYTRVADARYCIANVQDLETLRSNTMVKGDMIAGS